MKLSILASVVGILSMALTGCNQAGLDESATANTISNLSGKGDSGWELVWSDEFEGDQIDSDKWEHEVNC